MPGYASKTVGFQTVPLSEGYTATIRKLRKKDLDACVAMLLTDRKQTTEMSAAQEARTITEASQDSAAYTTELLVRGIMSWTLDDDDEAPIPVTRQAIEEVLSAEDSTKLVSAIENLIGKLDPKSQKAGDSGSSSA